MDRNQQWRGRAPGHESCTPPPPTPPRAGSVPLQISAAQLIESIRNVYLLLAGELEPQSSAGRGEEYRVIPRRGVAWRGEAFGTLGQMINVSPVICTQTAARLNLLSMCVVRTYATVITVLSRSRLIWIDWVAVL